MVKFVNTSANRALKLVNAIRESDENMACIYTMGGCYKLHLVIKSLITHAKPYINDSNNHIITLVSGQFFDINGRVDVKMVRGRYGYDYKGWRLLKGDDLKMAEKWSFSKNRLIKLAECPYCEEPIVFNINE